MRNFYEKSGIRSEVFKSKRLLLKGAIGIAASAVLGNVPFALAADNYPAKPIKLITPFPPGGATDTAARIVSEGLSELLKTTFVVENKGGAAGAIGTAALARSAADGYTLGIGPVGSTIIAELIGMPLQYNPAQDLAPIANIGALPLVFVARGDLPVKDLNELVALAKKEPGKFSYGTSGAGTPGHLAFEYFSKLNGVDIVHIPYKGGSTLVTDLLGGRLDLAILTGPNAIALKDNKKVKALAVTSGQRYPQMPDIPTVAESGIKNYNIEIWNLLIAPAGIDQKIVEKLNAAVHTVLTQEKIKETLYEQGYLPVTAMDARETADFLATERKKWEAIVKTAEISMAK